MARETAAVIALPIPAHAVGADLTAAHTGATYLGNAAFPDGTAHPVLWHRTGFATFTTRVLPLPAGMDFGWSSGSNPRGAITVSDSGPDSSSGFVLFHGRTYRLPDLAGSHQTDVYGINDRGMAYGDAVTPTGAWVAVAWHRWTDRPRSLDLPPNESGALALGGNDQGQLVGYAYNDADVEPVSWNQDGRATILGATGSNTNVSAAYTISHAGRIVGQATWPPDGRTQATTWRNRGQAPEDLGALPGDVTSRIFEGSPDGRASGVSFNVDFTVARVAYWPGHGRLESLPPYGNAAWGSSGHGVSDDGEVQGATVPDLANAPAGDIPTLWTDADAQAFIPAGPAPAVHPSVGETVPQRMAHDPLLVGAFPLLTRHWPLRGDQPPGGSPP